MSDTTTARAEVMIETRAPGDGGGYVLTIAANDVLPGRPDDELRLSDLKLDRYRTNPVVLFAHQQWNLPVAKTTDIEFTDDNALRAEFEFMPGDAEAARVKNAWDRGFLNAASIGWNPHTMELLEWSLVPVPDDPDAIRSSYVAALDVALAEVVDEEPTTVDTTGQLALLERDANDSATVKTDAEAEEATMPEKIEPEETTTADGEGEGIATRAAPALTQEEIVATINTAMDKREAAAAEKRAAEAKTKADSEEVFTARVAARAALLARATPLLPEDFKADTASERDLVEAALGDAVDLAGRSDEYAMGVFDMVVGARERAAKERGTYAATATYSIDANQDDEVEKAIAERDAALTTAWEQHSGTKEGN